ncbi:hypothetical protein HH299_12520, partial [Xanthomonas sp. Kuri4-2]
MNRIYRKVWNKSLGLWTVASELATAAGPGAVGAAALTDRRVPLGLSAAIALAIAGAGMCG